MTSIQGPFQERISPCWQLLFDGEPETEDGSTSHYFTELEAAAAKRYALGLPWLDSTPRIEIAPVTPEPCWTAGCMRCGLELVDVDTEVVIHHSTAADALASATAGDWRIVAGQLLCADCVDVHDREDTRPGPGQLGIDGSEVPS